MNKTMGSMNTGNLKELKQAVERITGVDNIFEKKRDREITDARCLFHRYAYDILGLSLAQISRYSTLNHSTVIHSLKKFSTLYSYEKRFKKQWEYLVSSDVLSKSLTNRYRRYEELDKFVDQLPSNERTMIELFKQIEKFTLSNAGI